MERKCSSLDISYAHLLLLCADALLFHAETVFLYQGAEGTELSRPCSGGAVEQRVRDAEAAEVRERERERKRKQASRRTFFASSSLIRREILRLFIADKSRASILFRGTALQCNHSPGLGNMPGRWSSGGLFASVTYFLGGNGVANVESSVAGAGESSPFFLCDLVSIYSRLSASWMTCVMCVCVQVEAWRTEKEAKEKARAAEKARQKEISSAKADEVSQRLILNPRCDHGLEPRAGALAIVQVYSSSIRKMLA